MLTPTSSGGTVPSLKQLLIDGRLITRIKDTWYDVTDFVDRHPGGDVIKSVCNGNDGTAMFFSSHFRPMGDIGSFPGIVKIPDNLDTSGCFVKKSRWYFSEDPHGFYATLKREVHHHFMENDVRYRVPSIGARVALYTALAAFAVSLHAAYIQGYMLGAVFAGVLSWNFSGTLTHDHGAHQTQCGPSKDAPWQHILLSVCNAITFPGAFQSYFFYSHAGHHSDVHDSDLDSDDKLVYPMLRWNTTRPQLWFHSYQHIYWPLAHAVYLTQYIGKGFTTDKEKNWWKQHNHSFRAKRDPWYIPSVVMIALVHIVIPVYFQGLPRGLGLYSVFFAIYSTGGLLFATLSHFLVMGHDGGSIDHPDFNEWAYHTVATSGDYMTDSTVAFLLAGGFNLHGIHHLMPAIHPSHLPRVYVIYKELCNRFHYPIIQLDSWSDVFSTYTRCLKKLGQEPDKAD